MTEVRVPSRAAPVSGRGDDLLWSVYRDHFASLTRLACLLDGQVDSAEDLVQEAFVRVYAYRDRLEGPDHAVAYLRRTIVNLSRSRWRRARVALRHPPTADVEPSGPEERGLDAVNRAELLGAIRRLSRREREVVVLRFYLDLSVNETAEALSISAGSVKSYTSRGLTDLAAILEERGI